METFINYESLVVVGLASFILSTIFEGIKTVMKEDWGAAPPVVRRLVGYTLHIISAVLIWFTLLDALPGFAPVVPQLGRVLTCILGGLGQKWVYDIWHNRPVAPERDAP